MGDIALAAAYIGAALVMGIGSLSPAYGQGLIGARACENMGKYPESARDIRNAMLLSMAIVESSALYAFIIALMLLLFK
jgi:F-type H+-transporting ATPase subunit c